MWQSREFRLSPKDHWEMNGILEYLKEWNQLECPSILAIFGPTDDRDTWVTEFSLDMIQAFQVENVLVASAMCDRPAGQVFTPTVVIKTLICQLLERNPELILEAPEILNLRTFHRVGGFGQACMLFRSIVARLTMPLAIIVDRIDCCEADRSDSNESQDLIGFLSKLPRNEPPQLKVIITSADMPPDDEDLPADLAVSTCMIATRTRPFRKEAYYQGTRRPLSFMVGVFPSRSDTCAYHQRFGREQLQKWCKSIERKNSELFNSVILPPRMTKKAMIFRHREMKHFFDAQNAVLLSPSRSLSDTETLRLLRTIP